MWVHVQLSLYGNILVRTFFKLVSDLVVVVIFEREGGERLTTESRGHLIQMPRQIRKHKNDLLTQCSCDI